MLKCDEDALICDLAETYKIYDYKSLPLKLVATFSIGLRENSRIKTKLRNEKVPYETLLQAMMVDRLSLLVWSKTKDAQSGSNRPPMLADTLLGTDEQVENETLSFSSVEEFEKARNEILQKGGNLWQKEQT